MKHLFVYCSSFALSLCVCALLFWAAQLFLLNAKSRGTEEVCTEGWCKVLRLVYLVVCVFADTDLGSFWIATRLRKYKTTSSASGAPSVTWNTSLAALEEWTVHASSSPCRICIKNLDTAKANREEQIFRAEITRNGAPTLVAKRPIASGCFFVNQNPRVPFREAEELDRAVLANKDLHMCLATVWIVFGFWRPKPLGALVMLSFLPLKSSLKLTSTCLPRQLNLRVQDLEQRINDALHEETWRPWLVRVWPCSLLALLVAGDSPCAREVYGAGL